VSSHLIINLARRGSPERPRKFPSSRSVREKVGDDCKTASVGKKKPSGGRGEERAIVHEAMPRSHLPVLGERCRC